ncbi:MAG TPA: 2-hydroxychromene-2-carboxylate isomerase [Alphaproteobacteria bacterium]
MLKIIDYYFTPSSPWTYLGHQRFIDIIMSHQGAMNLKPVDYGKIFPVSGGLPVAKRAPQRQAYRLAELRRWRDHLGVPLNFQPKFVPVNAELASLVIIAAGANKSAVAPGLAFDFMHAVWVEERDIADVQTVKNVIRGKGLPADELLAQAQSPDTKAVFDALTKEAMDRGVFGAPTYVYRDELFWGQDRLEFLDRALAAKN